MLKKENKKIERGKKYNSKICKFVLELYNYLKNSKDPDDQRMFKQVEPMFINLIEKGVVELEDFSEYMYKPNRTILIEILKEKFGFFIEDRERKKANSSVFDTIVNSLCLDNPNEMREILVDFILKYGKKNKKENQKKLEINAKIDSLTNLTPKNIPIAPLNEKDLNLSIERSSSFDDLDKIFDGYDELNENNFSEIIQNL